MDGDFGVAVGSPRSGGYGDWRTLAPDRCSVVVGNIMYVICPVSVYTSVVGDGSGVFVGRGATVGVSAYSHYTTSFLKTYVNPLTKR